MPKRTSEDWLEFVRDEFFSSEIQSNRKIYFARRKGWCPRVDVIETSEQVIVTLELAGVRHEDMRISLEPDSNTLIVRGARNSTGGAPSNEGVTHLLEIENGYFEREIELPDADLDATGVTAKWQAGLVSIFIPKVETRRTVIIVTEDSTKRN